MSANFVYKHNLTTPTVISLLQLEAGEKYVFISIYRYKLGYNLLIHYLSILVVHILEVKDYDNKNTSRDNSFIVLY